MNARICPVCGSEHATYLNLARHMVLKDRPYGSHQQWLESFLNLPFEKYGFGHDKYIAVQLAKRHKG